MPFALEPKEERIIHLLFAWYVPKTNIQIGKDPVKTEGTGHYVPWYAGRFGSIHEVADYWRWNYASLRDRSVNFRDAFYDMTLPAEVVEAVAANPDHSQIAHGA